MKNVYLHEFNILMGQKVYLPNVSGMLRAYAEVQPNIVDCYQFMPFLFVRQQPEKIIEQWSNPSVLAFSSSTWNHRLNLVLAKRARELFKDVLIVFGGPHVPAKTEEFLEQYPFVDVVVRGEGEVTFSELLTEFLVGRDFSKVNGIVYRHPLTDKCVRTPERGGLVDVNQLPSPYLAGLYDEILRNRNNIEYQVIFETNRGCPFRCAYCYWGNGTTKIRTFDIGRIEKEIRWMALNEIQYVFGADANFGMLSRDREIAELFVKSKQLTGYPRTFRVCYGKNATDRIFGVAQLLDSTKLATGVTVSFQSTDPDTLRNIGRSNINLDAYRELLCRYREKNIRVYTELILGLPGETYNSFARGIEEVFQAGLYDQVGIFLCQVLPNTNMADPAYALLHGIETQRLELVEPHASLRPKEEIVEYEDVIVSTKTMPAEDWKSSARLAWMAQVIHGMKLGFFIALYLFKRFNVKYIELFEYLLVAGRNKNRFPVFAGEIEHYENYLNGLLSGNPQCVFLPQFGKISWQIEEATFLRLNGKLKEFYEEMSTLMFELLETRRREFNSCEVAEVVQYQHAKVSRPSVPNVQEYNFDFNIPEYFDLILSDRQVEIHNTRQLLTVNYIDYYGEKEKFAQQVIWFGRRYCRTLESSTWLL